MKLPYKVMSSAALSVVVASIPVIVHAQAGDFYNQTKQLKYSQSDLRSNATLANKLQDEMDNGDTIIKEVTTGQYLDYVKANDAFVNVIGNGGDVNTALTEAITAGATSATSDELNGYTPATPDDETLAVSSVSAITNASDAAVVTGSATGADAVKVSIDGAAEVVATLNADGTFTYTSSRLAVGNHTISVKAYKGTTASEAKTASVTVVALAIDSVTAVNSTTIKVVFNKAVDQTTAETTGNYTLTRLSTTVTNAITKATLNLTDNKTVLLTTTTATVGTTNGYALEVANVTDTATPANVIGTQEVVFSTVSTSDTEKPSLYGASYESSTGKLALTFNKNISLTDANFDETGITVKGSSSGYTLVDGDYTGAATSTGNTVTITLTDAGKAAVNALGSSLTLDVAAGSFKDATDISRVNDAVATYPVTLTSAPGLSSASYDENTSMLTLTFDRNVKVGDNIDLTKISVKRDGVSTALSSATATVQNTTANNVISIKLNGAFSHAGTTVLGKVSLTAGAVKNETGTANLVITDAALTYTNDTTKPTLVSATYNSGTKLLTLKFSEIVDVSTYTLGNTRVTDGTNTVTLSSGTDSAVKSTVDGTDVIISLDNSNNGAGDFASVEALDASKLKVYFAAGTVTDLAANSIAEITSANAVAVTATDLVAPTFNVTDPSTVSTVATVTFTEKVNKADAENIANYEIKSGAVVLPVTKATLLSDGKTVELTTGEQAGITYTVKVSNVKDLAGNVNDNTITDTFVGAVAAADTVGPTISSYEYTDVDGSKSISKGDKIKLSFNESLNVDYTKVTYADFLVNGGGAAATSFGTGATFAAGDSSNEVIITLGTAPTIAFGDTVNVAGVNDVKDLAGNIATASAQTIANPGTAPTITNFDYVDTNGDGDVSEGDKAIITYDRNINVGTLTSADFTFGAGITAGDATFAKTADNQITMTFGSTTAVTWGATANIDEAVSTNVTDEWGVSQLAAAGTAPVLKSADTTNPSIVSVTFNDTNGDKVMDDDETITIVLSEPVHEHSIFAAGNFVLYDGATANPYEGTGGSATDGTNVTANGNVVTITIGASDGWTGESVTNNTTFNFAAGTTSLKDAAGNNVAPDTGFGKTITIQ